MKKKVIKCVEFQINFHTMATLSALSKGYGSWTAGQVDPYFGEKYVSRKKIF